MAEKGTGNMSNSEKEGMAGVEGGGTAGLEKEVFAGLEREGTAGLERERTSSSLAVEGLTDREGEESVDLENEEMTESEGMYDLDCEEIAEDWADLQGEQLADYEKGQEKVAVDTVTTMSPKQAETSFVKIDVGEDAIVVECVQPNEPKSEQTHVKTSPSSSQISNASSVSIHVSGEDIVDNRESLDLSEDEKERSGGAANNRKGGDAKRILVWYMAPCMMTLVYLSWMSFGGELYLSRCGKIFTVTLGIATPILGGIALILLRFLPRSKMVLQIWSTLIMINMTGLVILNLPSLLPFPQEFTGIMVQSMTVFGSIVCAIILMLAFSVPMEGQRKMMIWIGLYFPIVSMLSSLIAVVLFWHYFCDADYDVVAVLCGSVAGNGAALAICYERLYKAYNVINSPEKMKRMISQLDQLMECQLLKWIANAGQVRGVGVGAERDSSDE